MIYIPGGPCTRIALYLERAGRQGRGPSGGFVALQQQHDSTVEKRCIFCKMHFSRGFCAAWREIAKLGLIRAKCWSYGHDDSLWHGKLRLFPFKTHLFPASAFANYLRVAKTIPWSGVDQCVMGAKVCQQQFISPDPMRKLLASSKHDTNPSTNPFFWNICIIHHADQKQTHNFKTVKNLESNLNAPAPRLAQVLLQQIYQGESSRWYNRF